MKILNPDNENEINGYLIKEKYLDPETLERSSSDGSQKKRNIVFSNNHSKEESIQCKNLKIPMIAIPPPSSD